MAKLTRRLWNYIQQPKTGAGLLYVALALGVVRLWLLHFHHALSRNVAFLDAVQEIISLAGPRDLLLAWTIISFALSCWLAYLLLRRRLSSKAMQRVLLIAVVHAAGAVRFYDWGLLLLSVMPLFALVPAVLFPQQPSRG